MTDLAPNTPPATVTVPSGANAMVFPTTNSLTGAPLSAREQHDLRMSNPTWASECQTPGTPAFDERRRLHGLQAAEEAGVSVGDYARSLADELRGYGQSEAQIAATLAQFGLDTRSVAAAPGANAQAVALPQTPPHEYRFNYTEDLTDPEQKQIDATLRGWLSSAGFSADAGSHLAERVDKLVVSREWDEASIEQHVERGRGQLREAWGAQFESNVQLLGRLIDDVEKVQPGINEFLHDMPHLLTDPIVAQHLLQIAQRRYLGA